MSRSAAVAPARPARRSLLLALAWVTAYFTARGLLERDTLAAWQRLAAALAPVPLFAAFLWSYLRFFRSLDELERRIHLEALGIASSLGTLLLTTLALLQRAVSLSGENWSYAHVWYYLPVFYLLAVGFISARYHRDAE